MVNIDIATIYQKATSITIKPVVDPIQQRIILCVVPREDDNHYSPDLAIIAADSYPVHIFSEQVIANPGRVFTSAVHGLNCFAAWLGIALESPFRAARQYNATYTQQVLNAINDCVSAWPNLSVKSFNDNIFVTFHPLVLPHLRRHMFGTHWKNPKPDNPTISVTDAPEILPSDFRVIYGQDHDSNALLHLTGSSTPSFVDAFRANNTLGWYYMISLEAHHCVEGDKVDANGSMPTRAGIIVPLANHQPGYAAEVDRLQSWRNESKTSYKSFLPWADYLCCPTGTTGYQHNKALQAAGAQARSLGLLEGSRNGRDGREIAGLLGMVDAHIGFEAVLSAAVSYGLTNILPHEAMDRAGIYRSQAPSDYSIYDLVIPILTAEWEQNSSNETVAKRYVTLTSLPATGDADIINYFDLVDKIKLGEISTSLITSVDLHIDQTFTSWGVQSMSYAFPYHQHFDTPDSVGRAGHDAGFDIEDMDGTSNTMTAHGPVNHHFQVSSAREDINVASEVPLCAPYIPFGLKKGHMTALLFLGVSGAVNIRSCFQHHETNLPAVTCLPDILDQMAIPPVAKLKAIWHADSINVHELDLQQNSPSMKVPIVGALI